MDIIKDFFAELRERASSPFISSFVIAWVIVNWPITVGLLFYSQADLKLDELASYTKLITRYSSWIYNTVIPLGIAFVYSFGFPYLKALIKLVHAKVSVKNESDILKVTKGGMMPVLKYIELKEAHDNLNEKLNRIIDTQSPIHNENTDLKIKLAEEGAKYNELLTSKSELQKVVDTFHSFSNAKLMNGKWKYISITPNGMVVDQLWDFHDMILVIDGNDDNRIKYMVANSLNSTIAITIEHDIEDITKDFTFWFTFNQAFTVLTSKIDSRAKLIREGFVDNAIPTSPPSQVVA